MKLVAAGVVLLAACRSSPNPNTAEIGTWHLPGRVDATNLEIRADGTFAWDIDGCDLYGGADGRWRNDAKGITLEPPAGARTLSWMDSGDRPPSTLRATKEDARLTVTGDDGARQTWEPGAVCPTCGGGLGPTAAPKKCDHKVGAR